MLAGIFHDHESTESAYCTLLEKGYTKDNINIVMSDKIRKNLFSGNIKETETGIKNGHIVISLHPGNDEDAKYFENN